LVRLLLRNGVPYKSFADMAKWVYVDLASAEFGIEGRKQSDSRVSVITGLSRKEVRRVGLLPNPVNDESVARFNRAARVISGWVRDKEFHDSSNRPASLPVEGESRSFSSLVQRYSGDVPARAILDELERVGSIQKLRNGKYRLRVRAYVPPTGEDEKLAILGTDVADLIATIAHNVYADGSELRYQRKVVYDNVPVQAMPRLRAMSARRGQKLLEQIDSWLSQQDRDMNPEVEGSGRMRAGVGVFYFEEPIDPDQNDED
jgi:hypothetical protein